MTWKRSGQGEAEETMPDQLSTPPTGPGRRRVFLSSTWKDLWSERAAVRDALEGVVDIIAMEMFRPNRHPGLRTCLEAVSSCDAILLIVGSRYGTIVPDTTYSVTEREYDFAQSLGLETFVYEQAVDGQGPAQVDDETAEDTARAEDFRHRLRNAHYTVPPPFSSPEDLATRAFRDIKRWIGEVRRPSFRDRRAQAIRSPDGYALANLTKRKLQAKPFPVMIVDLAALNAQEYPPEPPGRMRITGKALTIRETALGHPSPVDILNDFPFPLVSSTDLLEARVALANQHALLVCLAHSEADLRQLHHFTEGPAQVALFSPEEAELPDDARVAYHKTYTQQQLKRCGLTKLVLDLVEERVNEHLVTSLKYGT